MRTEVQAKMAEMRADIDSIRKRLVRLEVIFERAHPSLMTLDPVVPAAPG